MGGQSASLVARLHGSWNPIAQIELGLLAISPSIPLAESVSLEAFDSAGWMKIIVLWEKSSVRGHDKGSIELVVVTTTRSPSTNGPAALCLYYHGSKCQWFTWSSAVFSYTMGQRRVHLESKRYTGASRGDSLPNENDKWTTAAIIPQIKARQHH